MENNVRIMVLMDAGLAGITVLEGLDMVRKHQITKMDQEQKKPWKLEKD